MLILNVIMMIMMIMTMMIMIMIMLHDADTEYKDDVSRRAPPSEAEGSLYSGLSMSAIMSQHGT